MIYIYMDKYIAHSLLRFCIRTWVLQTVTEQNGFENVFDFIRPVSTGHAILYHGE